MRYEVGSVDVMGLYSDQAPSRYSVVLETDTTGRGAGRVELTGALLYPVAARALAALLIVAAETCEREARK